MRIALYQNLDFGGAKISLFEWIKNFRNIHNVEIDYYKYSIADENNADLSNHVNNTFVYYLPEYRSSKYNIFYKIYYLLINIVLDKKIAKTIDCNNYDLVFINHSKFIQAPYLMRFIKKTKIYYFCQEPYRAASEFTIRNKNNSPTQKLFNWIRILPKAFIDKFNFSAADVVLCNSEYSKRVIYRYYNKIPKVVHLGVNINIYKKLKNQKCKNKIVSAGILLPHKGYELTIRAIGLLDYDKRPELHIYHSKLNSTFENLFRIRIIELSSKLKVKLVLYEQKSSSEIAYAYNSALFSVYAANLCPLGIVTLEAMACSTPVIGSKEGGVQETIKHGVTGYLTSRNPEAFASKMNLLINKPNIRNNLSKNCREYIEDYWSWQASTDRLYNHFKY